MPNQFRSPEGDLENYFVTEYWLIDQYVGDTLFAWGNGSSGQLGINATVSRSTPVTTFAGGENWNQVACGTEHTAAVKTDGTLWLWGNNTQRQLGDNTTTNRPTPVTTFAGGTNWKQVACGFRHTAAIKTDGTLWTWGQNGNGQLGENTTTSKNTPVTTFSGGNNWKQVDCGDFHTAAIKTDGTLWLWGTPANGVLGINSTVTNRPTPVTTFAGGTNWKQVSGGSSHTAAIKTDGTLWTWGSGSFGQLGNNTTSNSATPVTTFAGGTNWKQVECGEFTLTSVKTNGTLWVWGRGGGGGIGDNTTLVNRSTPVTTFAGGTNWKQVSGGGYFMSAIKTDGTLWTWGAGGYGRLGGNNIVNRPTPAQIFLGGTNWKQVSCGGQYAAAVTSGTNPTDFIS